MGEAAALAVAAVDGGGINAKTAISIRQTLIELGRPQPRTPMQTDNATAHALLANKNLTQITQGHGHAVPLYGAATPEDNSAITGDLAHRTWQITSPSTTPPHTTSLYAQQFSHQPTIQNTGNSSRTQETPRIWRAQIITSEKKTS